MKNFTSFASLFAASTLASCTTRYVEPNFVLVEETYSAEGHKRVPPADKPEYLRKHLNPEENKKPSLER